MYKKRNILKKVLFILIILFTVTITGKVYAEGELTLQVLEPTKEYQEYMNLTDEEKEKVLQPKKYDVIAPEKLSDYLKNTNNVFKLASTVKDSVKSKYDLREIIGDNVQVRNQMQTDSCWAFAGTALMESNLGMLDYKQANAQKTYDFSERHMFYSAKRNYFNNNEENPYGYSTSASGGNFGEVQSYYVNGMGAINEEDMPFENNEDKIDISEIQNKVVATTLYDTIEFENIDDVGKTELMAKMKETITNYGGIFAGVHGAQIFSDAYNNATAAIYCANEDDYPMNHAVLIIGWDDNFSKDNFNETNRPSSDGAWIVKNSWGDKQTVSLKELKESFFTSYPSICQENGWEKAEDIDNEYIRKAYAAQGYGDEKVTIDGDNVVVEIGDQGYMYISYEDANIYDNLYGIKKATNQKDYDKLYQHDKLMADTLVYLEGQRDLYIANKFNRNSSDTEVVDKIGFYTMQKIVCNVLINPHDSDLNKDKLQEVSLKQGKNLIIEPGYHILELSEPVQLTGDSFAVALEISSYSPAEQTTYFMAETRNTDENFEVNPNESFFTTADLYENNVWEDLSDYDVESVKGNVSIKAYTKEDKVEAKLESIRVTNPPSKTEYYEGENFEKEGLKITATYTDHSEKEVTNFTIVDGDSLYLGQKYVTIQYTEDGISKTTTQEINVKTKDVSGDLNITSASIYQLPNKLKYIQYKEVLDLKGGLIKVTYSDNTMEYLKMETETIVASGFDNTKLGKQTITLTFMNRKLTFEVEIIKDPSGAEEPENPEITLTNIYVQTRPNKLSYIEGEDFDPTGMVVVASYSNGSTKVISNYTIIDGNNLSVDKTSVTIQYEEDGIEKTTTQNIIVNKESEVQPEEPDNPDNPDNPEIIEPKLSDLSNIKSEFSEVSIYTYTTEQDSYITMKIKISNILDSSIDTNYTYYYYFSSSDKEENIENWIKIENPEIITEEDGSKSIVFSVDSRNISNYAEIVDSDKLYLYIKEEAEASGKVLSQINASEVMQTENTKIKFYGDDDELGDIDDVVNIIGNNKNDNTIAKGTIPQAGVITIGIAIILFLGIGIYKFIRYRNIDK